MWLLIGMALACAGTTAALLRARTVRGGFYDADVYGMSRVSHLRFAAVSAAFALALALAAIVRAVPALALIAIYVVLLILYAASFVRGAVGEDE